MKRRFVPNRAQHDLEDPDLGAATMDDNTEAGGGQAGGEAGGSGLGVSFDDWPDDDEAEVVPRHQPAPGHSAGSSTAPPARGGGKSVVPRRVCSAVGRRSPEAGQRRPGGRRRREGSPLPQGSEAAADGVSVSVYSFAYSFFFSL